MIDASPRRWIAGLVAGLIFCGSSAAASPLAEPYQMVRSMRLLQDRVAAGHPGALSMLRLVLARIGTQLREVAPEKWADPKNGDAIITYLLNGGNPAVVRAIYETGSVSATDKNLFEGALAYATGDTPKVIAAFSAVKPGDVPLDLLDSIYLVTSLPLSAKDPAAALGRLDYVRLTAPGTLLEEASIRRSLAMTARLGDVDKFRILTRNYLQRFNRSPYFEDFQKQFTDALVLFKKRISDEEIAALAALAPDPRQLSIFLRVARAAILDGEVERAKFASRNAEELSKRIGAESVQARLYAAAGGVATPDVKEAARELATIPRDRLRPGDAGLLDAAMALAGEILKEPDAASAADLWQPANAAQSRLRPRASASEDQAAFDATVKEAKDVLSQIDDILGDSKR